ncbi:MAG: helix-turn-helix domain-containing protein, partial [Clostridium sp.]|nr:helix-turn-helix domain-containing protein [Clostridium sp.]
MSLPIGRKIKEFRRVQDVTQEKLADYLHISYQAISKWENGSSFPDITLLPGIARFFGVSSDELLGLHEGKQADDLTQFDSIYQENSRKGKTGDNIDLCRKVLAEYPREYQWMLNLSYALVQYNSTDEQSEYSREHGYIEEAINICERILEDCTTDSIRHGATQILCYYYPHVGKKKQAIALAEVMPEIILSKEALLSRIFSGEEQIKQNQQNLLQMIDYSAGILVELSYAYTVHHEKIACIKAANTLYQTVLQGEEDSLFYHCRLSDNYLHLAQLMAEEAQNDEAQ